MIKTFWLRNDIAPLKAVVKSFDVNEGVVKIRAAGLAAGQKVGFEVRMGQGADIVWTPYTKCNALVELSATNTTVLIMDTGNYRIATTAPVGAVQIEFTEDETTVDGQRVYTTPIDSCFSSAPGGGTTANLTAIEAVLQAACGTPQTLNVNACGTNPLLTQILAALTSAKDFETFIRCAPNGEQVLVVWNNIDQAYSYIGFPGGGTWVGNPATLTSCAEAAVVTTNTTVGGVNTQPPANLRSIFILKTSTAGVVDITLSSGSYPLNVVGETFGDETNTGATLPLYLLTATGGATWKWHGVL